MGLLNKGGDDGFHGIGSETIGGDGSEIGLGPPMLSLVLQYLVPHSVTPQANKFLSKAGGVFAYRVVRIGWLFEREIQ